MQLARFFAKIWSIETFLDKLLCISSEIPIIKKMKRNYLNDKKTQIFAEKQLRDFLEQRKLSVIQSIQNEDDNYLLNVNENDYFKHKLSLAYVDPLQIHEEKIYASSSEQMIPAEQFPFSFNVREGKIYKQQVIKFHIPFSGIIDLVICRPSCYIVWSMGIELHSEELCFEIINFNNDTESIKQEKDANLKNIMQQLENVNSEIKQYNIGLESEIKKAFNITKKKILSNNDVLASLGIPIKKADNVSSTFAIPTPQIRKKIVVSKPTVKDIIFKPEPTIDEKIYYEILKSIHDVGKQFERLPSLYANKQEEPLRDHFLMMLEPNFEGSATGETFNKEGDADILLRYEGKNVFIAECKFWDGKKVFLNAISQLLGYLTWRDSKAAVIMFVPNKDFTSVLKTAKSSIVEHPNYLDCVGENDETWFNYIFHLNDDRNRKVYLAVMFYHLPK